MLNKTPLATLHEGMGGKMVDFGGWYMPVNYGSQIDEHNFVRQQAGMFDVSHMTIVDVRGVEAKGFLQNLLANDVDRLGVVGKALYTGMLNEKGGVIDDLIVYLTDWGYRLVVNCATREKDLAWIEKQAQGFDIVIEEQPDLSMVAVQGPQARGFVHQYLGENDTSLVEALGVFHSATLSKGRAKWMVARTGYTGEDGYEVILPASEVNDFWQALADLGVKPCGLGARDTLRLEAGMNLYGHEMDEKVSPLQANMAWTIAWEPQDRRFIGRTALEEEKQNGVPKKLVGLVLEGRGVLREGYEVRVGQSDAVGVVTSGTFSPTLSRSIGLARLPLESEGDATVIIRGKEVPAKITKPCFVRQGKILNVL